MMQVKQCNIKTKCEINGCKNLATITLCKENDAKFGLKICEDCAKTKEGIACNIAERSFFIFLTQLSYAVHLHSYALQRNSVQKYQSIRIAQTALL